MKHDLENTTNDKNTPYKENIIMKNLKKKNNLHKENTTAATDLAHLDYQDVPEVALMKLMFPFCKTAKVGNLFYPVIPSGNLMDFIACDDNFVEAARKVKLNAINPSGSEHGIVKKVCDMFLDTPSFREIICHDLLHGTYSPEKIASDPIFIAKHMTLPRGFKYTANQVLQTMIMQEVEKALGDNVMTPYAWSERSNPGVGVMIETIDGIRARGFKYWISFKLKSLLDNIPHDILMQKIRIVFQDKTVADLICDLVGLNAHAAGDSQTKHIGIPKDSPLATFLAYDLYLSELDQEIKRRGLAHVRYNDEIVVFCENKESAEQIRGALVAFVKNEMKCPVDHNRTRIKDISHLAFLGLQLQGGRWRIQYSLKDKAAGDYLVALIAYAKLQDDSLLWRAYGKLTKFISLYEDVYALQNEIQRLKKWRDDHFTNIIAFTEKVKLGLVKLPD